MDYIQNLERVLNKISDLDQISLLRSRVINFWIITFDILTMSKWSSWSSFLIKMWSSRSEKRCLKNTFFDGSVPRTRQRTKKREIFFFHRFDPPSEGGSRDSMATHWRCKTYERYDATTIPMVWNFEFHSQVLAAVRMILERTLCLLFSLSSVCMYWFIMVVFKTLAKQSS